MSTTNAKFCERCPARLIVPSAPISQPVAPSPPPTAPPELPAKHVGTAHAAALLGVSQRTVVRLCDAGKLPAVQFGHSRHWLISEALLLALIPTPESDPLG